MAYVDMSSNWFYKKPVLAADLNQLGENDNYILRNLNNLSLFRFVDNNLGTLIVNDNTVYTNSGMTPTLVNTLICNSNIIGSNSILRFVYDVQPSATVMWLNVKFTNMADVQYPTVYFTNVYTAQIQGAGSEFIIQYPTTGNWISVDIYQNVGLSIKDSQFKIKIYLYGDGAFNSIRNFNVYEFPNIII
jgi:hypothetical protein